MPYTLPPDLRSLLDKYFSLGNYASEDDVLRDAFRALEDQRESLEDIHAGITEMEAGQGSSLEDVEARLRQKFSIPRAR
jgi:Arc/MetJ-type ribon-helix-helix transcriptional regulator